MRVRGNHTCNDLLQPHSVAIVVEQCRGATQSGANQPIRAIIPIIGAAIIQQVAVVVPGIRLPTCARQGIHAAQAIGGIVLIRGCPHRRRHGDTIAHAIVAILIALPGRIRRTCEALQRIVGVTDDAPVTESHLCTTMATFQNNALLQKVACTRGEQRKLLHTFVRFSEEYLVMNRSPTDRLPELCCLSSLLTRK